MPWDAWILVWSMIRNYSNAGIHYHSLCSMYSVAIEHHWIAYCILIKKQNTLHGKWCDIIPILEYLTHNVSDVTLYQNWNI